MEREEAASFHRVLLVGLSVWLLDMSACEEAGAPADALDLAFGFSIVIVWKHEVVAQGLILLHVQSSISARFTMNMCEP